MKKSVFECKEKWTVRGDGKAWFRTVAGQTYAVEPGQIDAAKSDETTKYNGAQIIGLDQSSVNGIRQPQQKEALGSQIKLRNQQAQAPRPEPAQAPPPPVSTSAGVGAEVVQKFERAFENVGIFEHRVSSGSAHSVTALATVDSEEKVFNAISASAFLIDKNAGVPGVRIDTVELFMRTTTGGAAGKFLMTREDAQALLGKKISREDYFVRNVIY
jgi:hypothetical protein